MKDPTAMPMMVPVDSCVVLEGWSRFGDRATRLVEFAAELCDVVRVVKSDDIVLEVVVVVAGRDSDDVVTVCCATMVFGLNAELIAMSRLDHLICGQFGLFERLEELRTVMDQKMMSCDTSNEQRTKRPVESLLSHRSRYTVTVCRFCGL